MILSTVVLAAVVLFLPETLRTIAGNGSIELTGIHKPILQMGHSELKHEPIQSVRFSWNDILAPFKFLFEKDVFVTLLFGAVVYAVFSMVSASTTSSLKKIYGFDDVLVGLLFLPNG